MVLCVPTTCWSWGGSEIQKHIYFAIQHCDQIHQNPTATIMDIRAFFERTNTSPTSTPSETRDSILHDDAQVSASETQPYENDTLLPVGVEQKTIHQQSRQHNLASYNGWSWLEHQHCCPRYAQGIQPSPPHNITISQIITVVQRRRTLPSNATGHALSPAWPFPSPPSPPPTTAPGHTQQVGE